MLRRTKANYFRNLNPKDSKQFWKAVKYLKKQQCTFPRFKQGGLTTNTDLQKAECLNSSCFNNFHLPLTQSHSHSSSETPCLPMFCTVTEVEQFLQDLEVSKASGPDKISSRMLKMTATSITLSITELFNLSIHMGKIQDQWKESMIVPIACSDPKVQ